MKVLLFGASGLTGSETLKLLLADPGISSVITPVRRELAISHPKLTQMVIDFEKLDDYKNHFKGDAVVIILGATITQAGSVEKFRQVDLYYPLQIARLSFDNGVKKLVTISTIIANPSSKILYTRTKGELEEGVQRIPFESIIILRPSFILGKRKEVRLKEQLLKPFGFLLPGKYRPIKASRIAERILMEVKATHKGVKILESNQI